MSRHQDWYDYFTSIQGDWGIWSEPEWGEGYLETCHRCENDYHAVRTEDGVLKCAHCKATCPQEVIDVYLLLGVKE